MVPCLTLPSKCYEYQCQLVLYLCINEMEDKLKSFCGTMFTVMYLELNCLDLVSVTNKQEFDWTTEKIIDLSLVA